MVSLMTVHGVPQYYVESTEELNNIPENAPPSTIAIVNTEDGVYKYDNYHVELASTYTFNINYRIIAVCNIH